MITRDDAGALLRMTTALTDALKRCEVCRQNRAVPCRYCQAAMRVLQAGVDTIDRLSSRRLRAVPRSTVRC